MNSDSGLPDTDADIPERVSGLGAALFLVICAVSLGLVALGIGLVQQRVLVTGRAEEREAELKRLAGLNAAGEAKLKRLAEGDTARVSQLAQLADAQRRGEEHLKELSDKYESRIATVRQSEEVQKKMNDLVLDLLLLAKTDNDAKAIVQKYNIMQNPPVGGGR